MDNDRRKKRRGSIMDLMFIIVFFFGMALLIGVVNYMYTEMISAVNDIGDADLSAETYHLDNGVSFLENLDGTMYFILFAIAIVAMILGVQIFSHPAFVVLIVLFVVPLMIYISGIFADGWSAINEGAFNITSTSSTIVTNFPVIIAFISLFIVVATSAVMSWGRQ